MFLSESLMEERAVSFNAAHAHSTSAYRITNTETATAFSRKIWSIQEDALFVVGKQPGMFAMFRKQVTQQSKETQKLHASMMGNSHDTFGKLQAAQHILLVHGFVRLGCSEDNINIKQLCHEFYHKNVIVYQQQKDCADIEEYVGMNVGVFTEASFIYLRQSSMCTHTSFIPGGHGGGQRSYVSEKREILTHLRVADLTLYNEVSCTLSVSSNSS